MNKKLASSHEERRVIILGKTGNGKSSTGNTILGIKEFKTKKSLEAVTSKCSVETSILRDSKPIFKVCDTPGFFDVDSNIAERQVEVLRSVKELCPNPHAFLLVLNGANRITEEEKCMIDLLRVTFGELVFDHCVLVFTRGGEFENDEEFEEFWNECELLTLLAAKCGNRVVRIENNPKNGESGLDNLLTKIEKACNNGSKTYSYEEIDKHFEELTHAIKLFDKQAELWRNYVDNEEKIKYETKETEKIMAFLKYMDMKLIGRLACDIWTAGITTTMTLMKCGVHAPLAHGVGAVTACVTGIMGIVSEYASYKEQQAALKHHKQN